MFYPFFNSIDDLQTIQITTGNYIQNLLCPYDISVLGDGICDIKANIKRCNFDEGDCCSPGGPKNIKCLKYFNSLE